MDIFSFEEFTKFLKDNDVVTIAIATLLSSRISELADSVSDNILIPFLSVDLDSDGIQDRKELENINFNLLGVNIRIGRVIVSIIKFVLITYLTFILIMLTKKINS